jgi:predicted N-formylglutamate amidohydrolase
VTENHDAAFVIAVHSFTDRLMGAPDPRPWPVGILWRDDEESARAMIAYLQRATSWPIGDNEPYDAREFNYSIDRHAVTKGLRHLTLEVRQDMLGDEHAVIDMAALLAEGVREVADLREN